MKKKYFKIFIFSLFFLSNFLFINNVYAKEEKSENKIKEITVCGDEAEWPPYSFYEIDKDGKKTDKLIGFTVDVLNSIAKKHDIKLTYMLLPWKRCLNSVKDFKENLMIASDLSFNPTREKDYFLTNSFYKNTPAVFYNKIKHKDGLKIKTLADLKKFSACGFFGYNYGPLGFKENEIDTGSRDIEQILQKVRKDRCDFFPYNVEIMMGFKQTRKIDVFSDPDFAYEVLSMKPPVYYHMAVSRVYPKGKELHELLNNNFSKMESDGTFTKLNKKWFDYSTK